MKKIIVFLLICCCHIMIYGQEQVFSYSANGTVEVKSKFVDSFDNDMNAGSTSNILKTSEQVTSSSGASYTVKCLKYQGWENDPGDFTVIEVLSNGRTIYTLNKDEGWDYFPQNWSTLSSCKSCYVENLGSDAFALLFVGTTIASQPPYLTVIVVKDEKATLAFNKPYFLENIQKNSNSTILSLQANTVEWIEEKQYNQAANNTLSIENGLIYYK